MTGGGGRPRQYIVGFQWPNVDPLEDRKLVYIVMALPGGGSGLRIDAIAYWGRIETEE